MQANPNPFLIAVKSYIGVVLYYSNIFNTWGFKSNSHYYWSNDSFITMLIKDRPFKFSAIKKLVPENGFGPKQIIFYIIKCFTFY